MLRIRMGIKLKAHTTLVHAIVALTARLWYHRSKLAIKIECSFLIMTTNDRLCNNLYEDGVR